MKITINAYIEHGAMFIHDVRRDIKIPHDTSTAPFTFTDTCVCFWVTPYDVGEAIVVISDSPYDKTLAPDFSCRIECQDKKIAFTDAEVNYFLIHHLTREHPKISIWKSNSSGSDVIWVQVEDLDLFASRV